MNGVFKLGNIATVPASQDVVGLKETDADQLLDQGVPFALQTLLIGIGEGFLEHGKRPPLGEGEGGIALFEVASHLCTKRLELAFGSGFATGRQAGYPVDVGGMRATNVFDQARITGGVERFDGVHAAFFHHALESLVVFSTGIGRDAHASMEFPWLELMTAQVPDGLEPCIQRRLSSGLADFVPRGAGMEHLYGRIASFFRRLDLLGVLVSVADFNGQRIVANVALDVDTEINFHQIPFLQDHFTVPAFNRFNHVVGGEVGGEIVDGDRTGERWLSTVPMDETFGRFDDFVKGLARLQFEFHRFKGTAGDVACIPPIL